PRLGSLVGPHTGDTGERAERRNTQMTDIVPFRLGTFSIAGCRPFPGLVVEDRVVSLSSRCDTVLGLLERWEPNFAALCDIAAAIANGKSSQQESSPLGQLRVHAPIPQPRTVYCSGANYKKHVVDLIIAHQDQAETHGMTAEHKRAW